MPSSSKPPISKRPPSKEPRSEGRFGSELAVVEDIRRARTLPSRIYSDPELFETVIEKVFVPSWQFLGDDELVKVPGSVHPLTLLEGSLDEPLLLTRDTDDQVHLLSNVCTHRGYLVAENPGCVRHLRCRYHGRRFALDGAFQSMPECADAVDFPSARDDLPAVELGRWGKLLFASLGPRQGLDQLLGEMLRRLDWLPLDELRYDAARSRDYLVRANWALYCDNYLEGFHIPFVHPSLDGQLDYGEYTSELYEWSNLQLGVASGDAECFDLPSSSPDHGQRIAAYYYWFFPNTMFNVYPWGISVNVVKPLAVDRTRVSFSTWLWKPELFDRGAGAELDRVEREDEAVVEGVQRGMRSRLYDTGRYSPTREQGVHHFHRLLARALGA